MRLEHLRKQFTEQLEMDRRLLVFFVDLLKTYDPAAYNKLQLDIARDYGTLSLIFITKILFRTWRHPNYGKEKEMGTYSCDPYASCFH